MSSIHILLLSELTEKKIKVAEIMLNDFYRMLPELYGNKSCTLNALLIIHLCHYVRVWGPLWTHTLFGFENFNGHITSIMHSKRKLAEQLLFSIAIFCQTIGNIADILVEKEDEATLSFFAPLSTSVPKEHDIDISRYLFNWKAQVMQ